jgi:hypothetical protein
MKKIQLNRDENPIDRYNADHMMTAVNTLTAKFPNIKHEDGRLILTEGGKESVHIKVRLGGFIVEDSIPGVFEKEVIYTPFMILTKFKCKGDWRHAVTTLNQYYYIDMKYIRVGTTFFKKSSKKDRFGVDRDELVRWTKETLVDDHSKSVLKAVKHYDGFVTVPNNINYKPVINKHYNMYHPFSHVPKKGKWPKIKMLLHHVFGDQYVLGLIYMQVLYFHPEQALPVLVLGSEERETGKTTFLDFMSQLFGKNMVVVIPKDVQGSFNSSFAHSNIVGIEETTSDKGSFTDSIKNLSTTKFLNVNAKYIDNYKTETFFKFIITTNTPKKFLRVDSEEIRFWVRELSKPKGKMIDHGIGKKLVKEIPAFLAYLHTLPPIDLENLKSRMVFTAEEIRTRQLDNVVAESRSELYKEIEIEVEDFFFNNEGVDEFFASANDLKTHWFERNHNWSKSYINKVIKDEYKLSQEPKMRYQIVGETGPKNGNGAPFRFTRKRFMDKNKLRAV